MLTRFTAAALTACLIMTARAADEAPAQKPTAPKAEDRAALEAKFIDDMTNVTLTGSFTIVGRKEEKLTAEKYEIKKVEKVAGDIFLIHARIVYGDKDVNAPVPLAVKWAGDTPVMTLTDTTIPGLGTFSARILVYRGWYAGTWQHDAVGGHMFGVISKNKAAK